MKCIALDFDHTLARLNDPADHADRPYPGLFRIFTRGGVPEDLARACYREVKKSNGFSIQNLAQQVAKVVSFSLDRDAIYAEFQNYLREKLIPYPETLATLREWRSFQIPVVILTAGDDAYQREKVSAVGVPHDKLVTIPRAHEKAPLVRNLLEEYGEPLMVLDDKASELDALRDYGLGEREVKTVRVRRSDSPYFHEEARYPHLEVKQLSDDALVKLLGVAVSRR